MVKVLQSDAQAHRLDALLALFKTKWPDFESSLTGERFPSPLLLLAASDRLAGGLSFTTALLPDPATESVWINAVMVLPEFQRRGLCVKAHKSWLRDCGRVWHGSFVCLYRGA